MRGGLDAGRLLLALLLLAGCAAESNDGGTYLLDGAHQPDVLTEARAIELPPATSGNRFLAGWWPWRLRPGAEVEMLPVHGDGRLEVTTLEQRPRELALELRVAETAQGRRIGVRLGGKSLPLDLPLGERVEIPLPASLPLGRSTVDLYLGDQSDVTVRRAAVRPSLAPGEVLFEGRDVLQSGESAVDFVRPVEGRARLLGRFEPPTGAVAGQEFELLAELEDGASTSLYRWRPAWWRRFGLGVRIDVQIPESDDERNGGRFVRIRLRARGEGPPGNWRSLRIVESSSPPAPPVVEPPEPPRLVVLYIMDALRGDHIGHLGGDSGLSPTVDRLAAEGAAFTNYMTVAPNTVPSMKTLFSGRVYLQGGTRRLRSDAVTLAERFRHAGFVTALLTGNGNVSPSRGLSRGFDYAPRSLLVAGDPRPGRLYNDNAERCHASALAWLDNVRPERAFIHIQTIHPHNPYDPPPEYVERFVSAGDSSIDGRTRTLLDIRQRRREVDERDELKIQQLYAGSVAYNDTELAHFLQALDERYESREVLFIFTSDHGDELFDHGGVLHGYTLYDEQLRVPLVFHWPGRIEPRVIDTAVDTLDLHYTLASLVSSPEEVHAGGNSLWPLLFGASDPGKAVRFAAASSLDGGIFMARSERYKLLWAPRVGSDWGMGQGLGRAREAELVFDLERDPGELDNLAGEDILEVAWLRERLLRWIAVGEKLEPGEDLEEMDEETLRSLRALGYIQ